MSGRYAEGTTVQPETSQQEIARLLRRYGADGFMYGWDAGRAVVAFRAHDRQVRFVLPVPEDPDAKEFRTDGRGRIRTDAQKRSALEAEVRRRWRALALAIKAKLEVVESGIATFEDEFLAHIVLPDGRTVGEHARPEIARAYELGGAPRSLLALPGGDS